MTTLILYVLGVFMHWRLASRIATAKDTEAYIAFLIAATWPLVAAFYLAGEIKEYITK